MSLPVHRNLGLWIPYELDLMDKFSVLTTLCLVKLGPETTGRKAITLKGRNLSIPSLMSFARRQKAAIAFKDSNFAIHLEEEQGPVWELF